MDEQSYGDDDFDDERDDRPVGSCEDCGTNIYEDEDDGSDLCDQCYFYRTGGGAMA